jgi:hypothetical protein
MPSKKKTNTPDSYRDSQISTDSQFVKICEICVGKTFIS